MIDEAKLQNLQEKAKNIRKSIVEMVYILVNLIRKVWLFIILLMLLVLIYQW